MPKNIWNIYVSGGNMLDKSLEHFLQHFRRKIRVRQVAL
jgi:hypothetical protein